ncbi:hypothetical protein [Streptomyces sp. NPDC026673]|uniref:hypothetical protein n=1 Tax=Streptomyces sp. NPDC026673 TaxID=3155724 RepID=UPI0033F4A147
MNTGAKVAAFAVALAATFGTAYGVGAAVDPVRAPAQRGDQPSHGGHTGGVEPGADTGDHRGASPAPGGPTAGDAHEGDHGH